jgi:Flp pilus assembly protein CpaB
VTISVNAESAVEGWVRPGVRVDLVWTTSHVGKLIATTLVENALVLSAERSVQKIAADTRVAPAPQGLPSHVTLLVTVKDSQKIHLARRSPGSMSLSLRGDADTVERGGSTIAIDNMLRGDDADALNALQGKIEFGGKSYVMRGGKLMQAYGDRVEKIDSLGGIENAPRELPTSGGSQKGSKK